MSHNHQPTQYNFGLASDIPGDYTQTNSQYNIGDGQNDVCSGASSALYGNVFQPSLLNKSSEYQCAAYQPDYIGADVNSSEATCTSCGGCQMSMDLSSWHLLPPENLYACSKNGGPPQLVNPLFSVSGAPMAALTSRDRVGLQMGINDQVAATSMANQEALAAQLVANAKKEEREQTVKLAQQTVVPAATIAPTTFLTGYAGNSAAYGSATPGMY